MSKQPQIPLLRHKALNQETLTTYDAGGNVLTVTDARGKVTTNDYDILGRLTQTTDAEGVITQFAYDYSGNRILVKDGKGNETTFTYDKRNRVILERYANGDETTYAYNALQKLSRTDAGGTTGYAYDLRDRLLTVDFPSGPDRTYAYDDAGQLLSVTETGNAAANVSYTYDLAGRALSETSRGKTHTHTYDAAGNRISTTYSTGRSDTRTYDALNRIVTLVERGRSTGWSYDLAGRAVSLSLGNGQQQDNHYDAVGKLTARHLFNPNQTLIATFQWQHDAVGNVTQQTERWLGDPTRNSALRTTTMVYDDVYRLLGESVAQSGEVTRETLYTYDDASNRAGKVEKENGSVVKDTSYTYNAANQLTTWSEENGAEVVQRSAVLTYDTRGNRASTALTTHGTEPVTATTTYAWTPQNMLSSVTLPGSSGGVHSYAHDYRVRRITRSEPGSNPVAMTFSGGLSVAEFEVLDSQLGTLNAQPSVEYQRGPDMGGGVGGLLYSLRSGTPKFNLSNGRGDVVAQSDASGDLTWTASYEAYGKRPVETGSNADRQRANTKEEDPTGLLNEGFRYRDLETGVWLSRDPAGFVDGPNLYAYVRQNPWTSFDPDGLQTQAPPRTVRRPLRPASIATRESRIDAPGHSVPAPSDFQWDQSHHPNIISATKDGFFRCVAGPDFRPVPGGMEFRNKDGTTTFKACTDYQGVDAGLTTPAAPIGSINGGIISNVKPPTSTAKTDGGEEEEAEPKLSTDGAGAMKGGGTRKPPSERAMDARDDLVGKSGNEVATVTGGYNIRTGQATAKGTNGDGNCAEDNVAATLGNNPAEIRFTPAIRPRTGEQVPVCERCETKYGRDKFPAGTTFKSDLNK